MQNNSCHHDYMHDLVLSNSTLLGKVLSPASKWNKNNTSCFNGGAYADIHGSGTPWLLVESDMYYYDRPKDVGVWIHEILHALGIEHTQNRPGYGYAN